jgi:plasmid maintenance system antidote protein VapI
MDQVKVKKKLSDVGKFLRKLRFENDEDQDEMANRLGVSTPYISLLGAKQPITRNLALRIIKEYKLEGEVKDAFIGIVSKDIVRRFWGGSK